MDFKAEKKTVEGLLSAKKQFSIPRFQREYSWGSQELKTFYEDIIARIIVENNNLDTSEYFLGSILLVGDMNDQKNRKIQVIDGQQRLTTITIFLSALYQSFINARETDLANKVWEYIMSQDNDLKEYAILENETPKPFFQFLVQEKKEYTQKPKNTEEENILKAYNYFIIQLKFVNIKKTVNKLLKKDVGNFSYSDLLKTIRNQLIRCVVVCIWTSDIKYANMIFEILNAKGKTLASIDLVKNSIFEVLSKEQPADEAKEKWKTIRSNLTSRNVMIDFSTFFRHYWVSTQHKCKEKKLYQSFLSKIPKSENSYLKFLDELVGYSKIYVSILKPNLETDYENNKQYQEIIKSSSVINELFGIVQARGILMLLFILHKDKKLINYKQYKSFVEFMEIFHFCYNALCSKRTSKLEIPYSEIGIKLYNATSKEECATIISSFKQVFRAFMPSENEIKIELKKLIYTKERCSTNLLSRYVMRKTEEYLSGGVSIDESLYSIEHILDENNKDYSKTLGNLLLFESPINNSMNNGLPFQTKIEEYKKSNYKMTKNFTSDYNEVKTFGELEIERRTEDVIKYFYNNIIISVIS